MKMITIVYFNQQILAPPCGYSIFYDFCNFCMFFILGKKVENKANKRKNMKKTCKMLTHKHLTANHWFKHPKQMVKSVSFFSL